MYREYDERFVAIETVIAKVGGVAIRIDKEHPLEDIVGRIKKEIRDSAFVVADLTDERQSCYFEAGFAEALPRPVIYVASKQSVLEPGTATKVHFDIHMNVQYFTNHVELKAKLPDAIEKNKEHLFPTEPKIGWLTRCPTGRAASIASVRVHRARAPVGSTLGPSQCQSEYTAAHEVVFVS